MYDNGGGNDTGEPIDTGGGSYDMCPELIGMNPEQGSFNVHYQETLYVSFLGDMESDPEANFWLETFAF